MQFPLQPAGVRFPLKQALDLRKAWGFQFLPQVPSGSQCRGGNVQKRMIQNKNWGNFVVFVVDIGDLDSTLGDLWSLPSGWMSNLLLVVLLLETHTLNLLKLCCHSQRQVFSEMSTLPWYGQNGAFGECFQALHAYNMQWSEFSSHASEASSPLSFMFTYEGVEYGENIANNQSQPRRWEVSNEKKNQP